MSSSLHRRSAEEFDKALSSLDDKLSALNIHIEIKAIGGYALLKHGIRQGADAVTVDIDSLTREYTGPVSEAIKQVAEEQHLSPGWLNTGSVLDDPEIVEEMIQAEWIPQDTDYRSIDLSIADVPTLTRSKIIAAADAELSGRKRDVRDLIALTRHQGISSLQQFRSRYPDPFDEFEPAYEALGKAFRAEYHRRFPELSESHRKSAPAIEHQLEP